MARYGAFAAFQVNRGTIFTFLRCAAKLSNKLCLAMFSHVATTIAFKTSGGREIYNSVLKFKNLVAQISVYNNFRNAKALFHRSLLSAFLNANLLTVLL